MKNHSLPQLFLILAIFFLFTLLFSQQGFSVQAAESGQDMSETSTQTATAVPTSTVSPTITVTTTQSATPTKTITPSPTLDPAVTCSHIMSGSFVVTGGDQLVYTVTNTNLYPVTLTNTTLYWTDFYDPDMYVDYFRFGFIQYYNGDSFSSPTTRSSSILFGEGSIAEWNLDFDGYGNIYGQTHTIGPFTIELTFDGNCVKSATIPAVVGQIKSPVEHQVIKSILQTDFEAWAWDTGVGSNNGYGIDRVHIVILDPIENVIVNRNDSTAPFCAWGTQSPCPTMSESQWNALPNGKYTMIIWGRSGVTSSWSPPHIVNFKIQHTTVRPTLTPTP